VLQALGNSEGKATEAEIEQIQTLLDNLKKQ
jgi:hypothetical protein